MMAKRQDREPPLNRKNAHELYSQYMTLALVSRTKGDRALFEDYYQRAEYYLYWMNELAASPGKVSSAPQPFFKGRYPERNRRSKYPLQKRLPKDPKS